MNDLLSGLRNMVWDASLVGTNRGVGWNMALDAVADALRNPTDEQVDALAKIAVEARAAAYRPTNQTVTESPVHLMVRAVLAAAAGGDAVSPLGLAVGDRIRFGDEKARQWYTVQAVSESGRWIVATRPAFGDVLYTLIDTVNQVRGVDDSIGNSLGYSDRAACERAIELIEAGIYRHSRRRKPIPLGELEVRRL